MIRHCVFIRFRPEITPAERERLFEAITDLMPLVPGMLAVHVGANVSPETGMDKGYSDGFVVDFDGPVARDAYLVHPAHAKAGAGLVAAAQGGVEGVLVYDIEITG